ncbi:MAG: NAD(P)H-hydrate dehydratase [Planctomycetes bacterium]|nr:NAD(P)H-hydrate dehydratase [Planctomycetota bacterium]
MNDSAPSLPRLPSRGADSHKGDFGKVLIVAGSRGMAGAAVLAGRACLRGGAGLVTVATPASQQVVVACGSPCYMTIAAAEDSEGRIHPSAVSALAEEAMRRGVVVLGPGCGPVPALASLVERLIREHPGNLVLDADALNVITPAVLASRKSGGGTVITPHPGEFARLAGEEISRVQADRQSMATRLARETGAVVLLKGRGTVVADAARVFINATGNPGMATGGSGDVLSGFLGALLGQGMAPYEAAVLGAHLHGLAGDIASVDFTQPGMIASDLVDYLPAAMARHARC